MQFKYLTITIQITYKARWPKHSVLSTTTRAKYGGKQHPKFLPKRELYGHALLDFANISIRFCHALVVRNMRWFRPLLTPRSQ